MMGHGMRAKLTAFLYAEGRHALRLTGVTILLLLIMILVVVSVGLALEGHWVAALFVLGTIIYSACRAEDRL